MTAESADVVYREGTSPLSLAEARRFVGVPVKLSRVSNEVFDSLLQASYEQGSHKAMHMVDGLDDNIDLDQVAQELGEPSDLLDSDDDAPIIRFINAILTEAVKDNASDVHIEPYENRLGVRFRVDGVLKEILQTRRALAPLVVSQNQGHVKARYRRKASAAGRSHFAQNCRSRGRRSSFNDALRSRRTRCAAIARQAGRPSRPRITGHGRHLASANGRADSQAPRHHSRDRPNRLG